MLALTDDQLTHVTRLAEPLAPADRSAFLAALANMLRSEPQPVGDGAVHRAAKQLLATGHYKPSSAVAIGAGAPRHHLQSRLRNGTAIGRARSK
jgi:hypothetical protein